MNHRRGLEGDDVGRAEQLIDAVATRLSEPERALARARAMQPTANRAALASLAGGSAGFALLFACLYRHRGREADRASALAHLDAAFDAIATAPATPTLHTGFLGPAWVALTITEWLCPGSPDPIDEELDASLLGMLSHTPSQVPFELIAGSAGQGLYLLARHPSPTAERALVHLLDALEASAVRAESGRTWHTPPEWLPEAQRIAAPQGTWNLGLSHGVPGVIVLLAELERRRFGPRVRNLLEDATSWLLAQQLETPNPTYYPAWHEVGERDREGTRLAWCYGDLGVCVALANAADALGSTELRDAASSLALHAATLSRENSGVLDAGLCHGAAGAGHLFLRLHRHLGHEPLLAAARRWFEVTLALGERETTRWRFHHPRPGLRAEHEAWIEDPTFLTGEAGAAIALIGAIEGEILPWDTPLGTALPERAVS